MHVPFQRTLVEVYFVDNVTPSSVVLPPPRWRAMGKIDVAVFAVVFRHGYLVFTQPAVLASHCLYSSVYQRKALASLRRQRSIFYKVKHSPDAKSVDGDAVAVVDSAIFGIKDRICAHVCKVRRVCAPQSDPLSN